tara:strand:+ start:142 stop:417 length:276 start_codon:yes stop_codon:yes gene_type:complete
MKQYKITNLKNNKDYYLTEEQKERFFTINKFYDVEKQRYNYTCESMDIINNRKFNKKLEGVCFTIIGVCIMMALYLGLCELLIFIDKTTII